MTSKYKPQVRWYLYTEDTHTQNSIVGGLVEIGAKIDSSKPFEPVPVSKGKELPMIPVPEHYFVSFVMKSKRNSQFIVKPYIRIGERNAGKWKLGEIRKISLTKEVRRIKEKLREAKKKLAEKNA
jgi:hypothetical protein